MVRERFAIYARRFPDRVLSEGPAQPRRGRPRKADNLSQFTAGVPETMGFAADTAAELGLSRRTIERAWTIVNGVGPELRAKTRGTWIARNDSVLRQLASLAEADKAPVIDILLQGETRSVSDAVAIASGSPPPSSKAKSRDIAGEFEKLWKAATASQRKALMDRLAGLSLPKGWAVIPTAAPEYAAYQARVTPAAPAKAEPDLLGDDDV